MICIFMRTYSKVEGSCISVQLPLPFIESITIQQSSLNGYALFVALSVHKKFTNNFSDNFLILTSEMCSGISKGVKMV